MSSKRDDKVVEVDREENVLSGRNFAAKLPVDGTDGAESTPSTLKTGRLLKRRRKTSSVLKLFLKMMSSLSA